MSTEYDLDDDENELDESKEKEIVEAMESQGVKELKAELKNIIEPMIAPDMFPPHPVKCPNPQDYPDSYNSNSRREELILDYVANFKSQFQLIYPSRKPLFMTPYNECGIEKFVCTTIRPTTLKFSKLYDWRDCAQFVADYLQVMLLPKPTDPVNLNAHIIPKRIK